nr:hypothetical protein [Tanacetum cinerariifolium]
MTAAVVKEQVNGRWVPDMECVPEHFLKSLKRYPKPHLTGAETSYPLIQAAEPNFVSTLNKPADQLVPLNRSPSAPKPAEADTL